MNKGQEWSELVKECMSHYRTFSDKSCVVEGSIPILYFGDYDRYVRSPIKVVTAALNPSLNEFPVGNRTQRFRYSIHDDKAFSEEEYRKALNEYFYLDPYKLWFENGFEKVLKGFGASYYGTQDNVVLHTDFCTPLATDPTWGKLGVKKEDNNYLENRRIKNKMQAEGSKLWHRLIDLLQPDVLILCLNKSCKINFEHNQDPRYLLETPTTKSERAVVYSTLTLSNGKKTLLVQGRTWGIPFGSIYDVRKEEVGLRTKQLLLKV